MKTYEKNIDNRKDLVKKLEQLTGQKSFYTFMPKCAYEVGAFTVNKDGTLTAQDDADQSIIETLTAEGMIGTEITAKSIKVTEVAPTETEESWDEATVDNKPVKEPEQNSGFPLNTSISFPLADHTVQSLTNLICMIHSRGTLLSKATGGTFAADKSLADEIGKHEFRSIYELIAFIREWEETNPELKGIRFADDKLIFDGFGQAQDADHVQTFMKLAGAMNRMAITQKRVQAKDVDDSNEKYSLRVWLIRLGLNGADFKADRKRLMENLSDHSAFRNDAERERWEAKQKAKREAQKTEEEENDAVFE